jgi:transcriptional regulator with XRE-family HTH domain
MQPTTVNVPRVKQGTGALYMSAGSSVHARTGLGSTRDRDEDALMADGDEPTEFGQYLSDAMRAQTPVMEREDLAELVGVDASTISRWITKPGKPKTENLHALADALGLDHGEVLARAGHGRPADNVTPIEPAIDPLLREASRMLDERSPLTEADRERLRIIIGSGVELFRPKMRRTRRAG